MLILPCHTYFHWHKCKEVCDEIMGSADVKFFLTEVFGQHNRLGEEQKDIISNGEFGNCFICFRELSQG